MTISSSQAPQTVNVMKKHHGYHDDNWTNSPEKCKIINNNVQKINYYIIL